MRVCLLKVVNDDTPPRSVSQTCQIIWYLGKRIKVEYCSWEGVKPERSKGEPSLIL